MLNLLENFAIKTVDLFVEISPYLILGFFFAGLLHTLLGEKYVRKHFARSGLWSTVKAAVFGIPLPVCSCAVIPLAESLRKDGASKSATMAFLVSTPSSGVDSILATYALMGPVFAVFRPIASFFSGILVGIVTHLKGGETTTGKTAEPEAAAIEKNGEKGEKSVKEIFTYGFKVIPSELAKWLLIGVVFGGAISAVLPGDFGVKYLLGSPVLNYVVILLISIPLYICATGSIPIAAVLMTKGVLPGAALALLIACPATNSVTIAFVFKKMGKRIAFLYIFSIIIVSVVSGLLFDALVGASAASANVAAAAEGAHLPEYIKWICAAAMALIFINTRYDLNFVKRLKQKKGTDSNRDKHTIAVPDMNCLHCKMKITQSLEQMPGVKSISIDLAAREVAVESATARETIIERIKQAGYKPQ